jgi:hypothetical protein
VPGPEWVGEEREKAVEVLESEGREAVAPEAAAFMQETAKNWNRAVAAESELPDQELAVDPAGERAPAGEPGCLVEEWELDSALAEEAESGLGVWVRAARGQESEAEWEAAGAWAQGSDREWVVEREKAGEAGRDSD